MQVQVSFEHSEPINDFGHFVIDEFSFVFRAGSLVYKLRCVEGFGLPKERVWDALMDAILENNPCDVELCQSPRYTISLRHGKILFHGHGDECVMFNEIEVEAKDCYYAFGQARKLAAQLNKKA
jgi:hypothetical protein